MDDNTHTPVAKFQASGPAENSAQQNAAGADAPGNQDLTDLRRNYAEGKSLHSDPDIWIFDGIATPDEMATLTERGREILKRAEVSGDAVAMSAPAVRAAIAGYPTTTTS
ncbi:hypothetical protein [Nocardia carnea]|uniref:Uncharacterized protein n=1 Tax=Nocardia carnea TaxID=37328 RepID=A0ABW7TP05_9NOCA|nr:hypothetical protein [Nocardia carnea]